MYVPKPVCVPRSAATSVSSVPTSPKQKHYPCVADSPRTDAPKAALSQGKATGCLGRTTRMSCPLSQTQSAASEAQLPGSARTGAER